MVLAFNPAMYQAIFGEEEVADEDVEEYIPETEADVQRMMAELARLG